MRKLIFFSGDVATRADTIVAVGPSVEGPAARVIDLQTLNDWNNGSIDSQVKIYNFNLQLLKEIRTRRNTLTENA